MAVEDAGVRDTLITKTIKGVVAKAAAAHGLHPGRRRSGPRRSKKLTGVGRFYAVFEPFLHPIRAFPAVQWVPIGIK
jgi:hypothetical protein